MKYDADIDPANANTSHHLMLELVGRDKRVLDFGCATGYLARALAAQGCIVSGVEIDPEAAEEARPALKELVVANLEELDLTDAFGVRAFDAVVFGDVLEHLTDPLTVLRGAIALLDEGGFVVLSIPNVAHGSVRLALLKGQFEYRELGLLDSTHLRFFTRDSLDALLAKAQLLPVERRRTVAGFFETEIPLNQGDYPPALLATLRTEPEVRTYQFVVKAIPVDSSPVLRRMYEENAAYTAEIARLRRLLDAVRSDGNAEDLPVQIGVWGHFGLEDLRAAMLSRIVPGELARRFPAGAIRCFAPAEARRIDGGEPIELLGPWSQARAEELAAELDAVVVTGLVGVPPSIYPAVPPEQLADTEAALVQGLGEELEQACPMLGFGVEVYERSQVPDQITAALARHRGFAPIDQALTGAAFPDEDDPGMHVVPDPLFLLSRFYPPELLRHRAAYLRLMGWFPESGPVIVVQGDRDLVDLAPALARVLDELAVGRGARCVLLESKLLGDDASFARAIMADVHAPGGVVPIDAGIADLLAAVASADAVIASSATVLAVAFALGRPCVGLDLVDSGRLRPFAQAAGVPDAIVRKPTEIVTSLEHFPTQQVVDATIKKLQMRLDLQLDAVAAIIADASRSRRANNDAPLPNLSLAAQLHAVQSAHASLQRRMAAERLAFADRAVDIERKAQDDLRHAVARAAETEARIQAIYATRTMRTLRPAREFYARLRSKLR